MRELTTIERQEVSGNGVGGLVVVYALYKVYKAAEKKGYDNNRDTTTTTTTTTTNG